MRIVLFGPQGAGKGTQAQRISQETAAKHISTGELVRQEIKSSSHLGQKIKYYNDRGELVPDEIIIEMMKPHLKEAPSWVLDGFPRNNSQAEALDQMLEQIGAQLDAAVALEAPDEVLIERLSGRRTSEATGRIYHIEHDPPPPLEGSVEEDPGPFLQREDDTEEAIRRRLEVYHEQTEPLKGYYAERGILARVDATQDIPQVTEDVLRAVRPRNRRDLEDHDKSRGERKVAKRKASDVFVECLEAEGVKHVFGIPGEETLDLNESLADSSIEFVPVRHEQGGAYIADVYGRLTGRAGVCLGTLGPGATNLVTAVADAYLDRAPLVALTGQGDLERMHKESHQYIDVVRLMQPITKWNARLSHPAIISEVVRKAFKVAETEKPGATHIELPEDVMAAESDAAALAEPLPRREPVRPEPSARDLLRAADLIREAANPVALAGNGVVRGAAAPALREFARATGIPVAETFMGKGLLDYQDPKALGSVGIQAGDYAMAGFEEADVVIAIGYDLVEHAPQHWNPGRDKKIVCIDSLPAEIDDHFIPEVELVGDMYHTLMALGEECRHNPHSGGSRRLREVVLGHLEHAKDDDRFPMQPPRVLYEIRKALGRDDVLISDVGLHKLWIGRMFPAHEPNTVLIANGLAGMGFSVPAAIAAKLVHPERKVVSVNGDGGFLMNCQELETAMRLKTPFVTIVWENGQYGSIVWKQDKAFGRHFGVDFGNPDFVKLAEAFDMPAWRCESAEEFPKRLKGALGLDVPSLIVLPIDYSIDVAISEELGRETVAT